MSLSELCTNYITNAKLKDESERNIIEFAEAPWGLGMGSTPDVPPLFPVQKFIFKCYYNIPLDNKDHNIIIKDRFCERERFRLTETEYLKFLNDEGRINIKEVTGDPADTRLDIVLVIGRRGCKTSSTAVLVSFETYKLLKKVFPQQYYNMMPDQEIRISCVATQQEQAAELFRMITGHLERADYFKKYRNKPTLSYMQLNTQRDLDMYGGKRSSIRIVASPCSGRGLRGHNNIIAILDEMAYFFEKESSQDRSDTTVYESVTPSTAKFVSPEGIPHGRTICISSPGARSGKFFELYHRSMEKDCDDILMIQAPSWEVDYTLSPKYLRSKYMENPLSYDAEFGANFSDRISAWIENEQVLKMNVIPGLRQKEISYERTPHFLGIDIGLKNDGTALAICHIERKDLATGGKKDYIELDMVASRYASDEDREFFTPEEMAEWISTYMSKFFIVKGIMDQYYGLALLPVFHEKGYKQIECVHATRDFNSKVYQNLMSKMLDGALRIPESEERIVNGRKTKDIDLVHEMLKLQATHHSKYLISVEAPEIKGLHDDESDAFGRAVYLATDFLSSTGGLARNNVAVGSAKGITYKKYMRRHKRNAAYTNRPSRALQAEMYSKRLGVMTPSSLYR